MPDPLPLSPEEIAGLAGVLGKALDDAMCDVSHHDSFSECHNAAKWRNVAAFMAPRLAAQGVRVTPEDAGLREPEDWSLEYAARFLVRGLESPLPPNRQEVVIVLRRALARAALVSRDAATLASDDPDLAPATPPVCQCGLPNAMHNAGSGMNVVPATPPAQITALEGLIHDAMPTEHNWRGFFYREDDPDGWWLVIRRSLARHIAARLAAQGVRVTPGLRGAIIEYLAADEACPELKPSAMPTPEWDRLRFAWARARDRLDRSLVDVPEPEK